MCQLFFRKCRILGRTKLEFVLKLRQARLDYVTVAAFHDIAWSVRYDRILMCTVSDTLEAL